MEAKKGIILRVYLVYLVFALFGLAIIARAFAIQFWEGEHWKMQSENQTLDYREIEAVRGNIFAADGSLLATSIPNYEIRMDMKVGSQEVFSEKVDSLAFCLSSLFNDKSANEYKKQLVSAKKAGDRYHLIRRNVNYNQLKKIRNFPICRLGKYKGGFIYLQKNVRERPFQVLAARTIGYAREGVNPVGLEGAYTKELGGVGGKRLMQKIAGGVWMPVNDDTELEPEDGSDLVTTLDINIQDVAEYALLTQLIKHNAAHGCVVLMEVSTGHIKAIANLSKTTEGSYYENYNYAIGASTEPGSTFKLATLMAAMEDGLIKPTDSVDTEDGSMKFYDRVMYDSHKGGYGKITVQRAFEVSTNVGVSKLINSSYAKNPQKFIDRLNSMNLNNQLNLEIPGEGKPKIKNANDPGWSGVSLPWMSIGYETRLTPTQILTFYNAVANNGKMVKPMFVKEIKQRGKVVKRFKTEILNDAICSKKTIDNAQRMLEGVVENGTAINLKNASYKIAGKTGTAQIANDKYGYKGKLSHQASFVGYFPADKPKYSCIVVVNAPSNNVYYGNLVAGPIFKEIADKVYATNLDIHKPIDFEPHLAKTSVPYSKHGYYNDLKKVFETLQIALDNKAQTKEWVRTSTTEKHVEIYDINYTSGLTPNVIGMGLQDASYLLENKGYSVRVTGRGMVKRQSVPAGTRIEKGNIILLELA
ncbi:MAG: transpeptidase family protein [Bacteroidetes bacterium]|nr:transpeptidase family protein [Bacteroidota bacterium]HET6245580.1 penicillin-binding protein [Bacteroidia bacterium]